MSVTFPHNYNPKELGQLDTEEGTVAFVSKMANVEEARVWLHTHGYGLEHAEAMLAKRATFLSKIKKK
jgi:hypothetical protein